MWPNLHSNPKIFFSLFYFGQLFRIASENAGNHVSRFACKKMNIVYKHRVVLRIAALDILANIASQIQVRSINGFVLTPTHAHTYSHARTHAHTDNHARKTIRPESRALGNVLGDP